MLGVITSSSFFVPQVNLPGNMASFIPPAIPIHAMRRRAMARQRRGIGSRPTLGDSANMLSTQGYILSRVLE
jgi:hypothetical protein